VGVPCRRCGRSYDVTLFQFGRTIWCTCGERVALAPRQRSPRTPSELRFFADAMLGRLARWLRIAGYDTRYEPQVEDADLVRIALEEGRVILTRDRALPREWSVQDVLVLDAEEPLQQLRDVGAHFPLDWRARAFTRCSRCNAPIAPAAPHESGPGVPNGVLAQRHALARCLGCGRLYWEGSHTERMRRALARALGNGTGSKA
jgi:uncharacterized protein with PIN domain